VRFYSKHGAGTKQKFMVQPSRAIGIPKIRLSAVSSLEKTAHTREQTIIRSIANLQKKKAVAERRKAEPTTEDRMKSDWQLGKPRLNNRQKQIPMVRSGIFKAW